LNGTTTVFIGEYLEWTGSTSTMKLHYYAGGRRIALRSAGTLLWLTGDHLGSATVTADAGGGSAVTQLYKAWGEVRTGSVNALATRYTFTGQAAEDSLGLLFYRARWYDPLLGRFISADTDVPESQGGQGFDRYGYVGNSPTNFVDPSGHWMCDPYDESCAENKQETAQFQIMAAGLQPASGCSNDPLCSDSYDTFVAVTPTLGYVPSMSEILYMTAGTEYYSYNGYSGVRATGQEGLARNYYEACGVDGCSGNELYRFIAGFQPWYGKPYEKGDGSASARSAHLINKGLHNDFAGTGGDLWTDIEYILDLKYAGAPGRLWTEGKNGDRPWQWYGPFLLDPSTEPTFGYGTGNAAILSVDMGNGYMFWMFTGAQDWNFNHNKDYWVMK
jgi:RHS repeat-associated protein